MEEPTGWFARLEKGHHWVTPQLDLFTDRGSVSYSETWPRSGTMRNGTAYRRVPSAPPTSVIASSFLPTPSAWDGQGGARKPDGKRGAQLRDMTGPNPTRFFPTPSANEPMLERRAMSAKQAFHTGNGSVRERRADGRTSNLGLSGTVMFPTPVSRDWKGTGFEGQLGTVAARGTWPTPKASPSGPDYARAEREGSGGDDLATAVARTLWPTIRATDGERGGRGDLIQAVRGNENNHYRLWPTPQASPNQNRDTKPKPSAIAGTHGWSLAGAVHDAASEKPHRMWPTPVRMDAVGARNKYSKRPEDTEHHAGTTLTDAMIDEGELTLLEKEDGGNRVDGGQLNPTWVEVLMGLPPGFTDVG